MPAVEAGAGYLPAARVALHDTEAACVRLVMRFYSDRAPDALARATRIGGSHRLAGVFALLARLCEETGATVQDVRDEAGDEAAALVDAVTVRPGETPRQTALRAVAHPAVAELLGRGTSLSMPAGQPSTWWAAQPEAAEIVTAELQRQRDVAEAQALASKYHYSLPGDALSGVVPIDWANAVYKPFNWLTEREYRSIYDPPGGMRYDARRVRRINEARHLIDCYQAGMTPDDYRVYVTDTSLTWKEMAAWHRAGLGPAVAAQADSSYARNASVARYAAQVTGDPRRIAPLFTWVRDTFADESKRKEGVKELAIALGWSPWQRSDERVLATRQQVDAAWKALLDARGGEPQARRILDLMRIVAVPEITKTSTVGAYEYTVSDWDGWRKQVRAWDASGLDAQRVELLIAAGVDADQAASPQTAALSDSQLRLAATLGASA